jgi:radical SAM/Cys-rich protein
MRDTWPLLKNTSFPAIERGVLNTLQLNLGYLCNISCIHCHVNAGPRRKELMDKSTMETALQVAEKLGIHTFDLTGGTPEMNPHFRWLVEQARERGIHVMDRLNPTIMEEPGYEWVGEFLAKHRVEAVASLPCYSEANVDEQRGDGVFEASIKALKTLNQLGYGKQDSSLVLNLVYNPNGAFLPPNQEKLEADYKRLLGEQFGIEFNHLYAIANMPIKRYGSWLLSKGKYDDYMGVLVAAHRDENLDNVMCRNLISVDYQGNLYDCDFNQMLKLAIGQHCYGCTAGQGSSCGGALN